ncbi:hypothetical protein ACTJK5_10805 [Agrobacterium sp. 22094]|uniref:hypothetical protein n=1 Tax=Agrobacterium sp. 22094 TaxID=3453872 RepID=UPI003F838A7A
MKPLSYRLPMPIVDIDQRFSMVSDLEHALSSLHERMVWFLSTRSGAEIDEEYNELAVYVWTVKLDGEYVTHVELAERRHALSHYPEDALSLSFDGTWALRRIEEAVKSDNWIASFLTLGVDQFLAKSTEGSIH